MQPNLKHRNIGNPSNIIKSLWKNEQKRLRIFWSAAFLHDCLF